MLTGLKTKIFLGVALLATVFLFIKTTQAASTSTLRGLAWFGTTDGIDNYLSFDCADDIIGDLLDVSGNLYSFPEPRGYHFYSVPCTSLVHGVSIAPNGNFFGDAWHYSLGLVSFDGSATPPDSYGFNSNCPSTCNSGNGCWSCYSTSTQQAYGWAQVDSTGEWIKLDSATTSPASPVMLQDWDIVGRPIMPLNPNVQPGDFIGYATSTLGKNFSFNCESEIGGDCDTRNYKVYVGNVQVGQMSAPNWGYSNACGGGALTAVLKWKTRSGTQAAYEIVVNDEDTFSTSTSVCWSGIKYSSSLQYTIPNADPDCGSLSYGTHYYWWLRVYSLDGGVYTPSDWYQFGDSVESVDNSLDTNIVPKTFLTYKHAFPSPFFSWSPFEVKVGTSTEFVSDNSKYYSYPGNIQHDCDTAVCSYLWSTTDPEATIYGPTNSTTTIIFATATSTAINLLLTDPDSYYCSTSTTLSINYGLPIWREVKPEDR
jgi:hypothetical protein